MRALSLLLLAALVAFAAWLAVRGVVPLPVLLTWSAGALCLAWLVLLVTVPWNLHFQAHAVLAEAASARARGVTVAPEREREARRIAARMLRVSIGAHVLSAAVMAAVTRVAGARLGYYFAAFYLLSTFVRPAFEYFRHLRARLARMMGEVRYPPDDVAALREQLEALAAGAALAREEHAALAKRHAELEQHARARSEELEKRLALVARRFEETVDRLTDNKDVIAGIKAFVRLIRAGNEPA